MFTSIRSRLDRRFAIVGLLMVGLLSTGIASLAALNDSLVSTQNFSVLNVDITGNSQQSLTFDYQFSGTGNEGRNTLVNISNTGNVQFRYAATATASGTAAPKIIGKIYAVAAPADCPVNGGTPNGTELTGNNAGLAPIGFGNPATGMQAGDRNVATGASEYLCLSYLVLNGVNQLDATDTAQQVITFSAESTVAP